MRPNEDWKVPRVSATLPDVMTTQALAPNAVRNLAGALGSDGILIRAFSSDGPLRDSEPNGIMWHLATCHRCGEDFSEPFIDKHARDFWAISHVTTTDHAVILSTDPSMGTAMVLRHGADLWSWLCTGCAAAGRPTGSAGGGFESGQLALADYLRHVCDFA